MMVRRIICILTALMLLAGCKKSEKILLSEKTILVYMIADNNLSSNSSSDIEEIETYFKENSSYTNLFLYVDQAAGDDYELPQLILYTHRSGEGYNRQVMRMYEEQNSSDPEVLKAVFEEVCRTTDKDDFKGVIFWSHGLGWLPPEGYVSKSYGDDANIGNSKYFRQMDIKAMAEALKSYHFEWMIFDACLMGGVEVMYEFKELCDYILASPTEISVEGMPYKEILKYCCDNSMMASDAMRQAGKAFFEYYEGRNSWKHSISVVDTEELEQLAEYWVMLSMALFEKGYTGVNVEEKTNSYYVGNIQRNDEANSLRFFDLQHFIEKVEEDFNFPNYNYATVLEGVMKDVLIYHNHSDNMGLEHCGGLSIYLPQDSKPYWNNYHKSLKWSEDASYMYFFGMEDE